MNYYLRDVLHRRCRVIGIDIDPHVIAESRKMAKRLGYHNMEFIQADLRTYHPPKNVTAVISLHACDIATDLALGTAVRAKAKLIITSTGASIMTRIIFTIMAASEISFPIALPAPTTCATSCKVAPV